MVDQFHHMMIDEREFLGEPSLEPLVERVFERWVLGRVGENRARVVGEGVVEAPLNAFEPAWLPDRGTMEPNSAAELSAAVMARAARNRRIRGCLLAEPKIRRMNIGFWPPSNAAPELRGIL